MPLYPLSTLAATIDGTGISAPPYSDIYQSLIASFQGIYGSDIYIAPDSQDGQWLAILAQTIYDSNQAAIACFQSFSPSYAQGAGLSSLVKINGLTRLAASNSTVDQVIIGQAGTIIQNGVTKDAQSNLWSLPALVTIPLSGTITVLGTCQTVGAITPSLNSVNTIFTPTLGWQSVTNLTSGAPGNPVESDPALRVRQTSSVALPSLTVLSGIVGAIENLAGVIAVKAYENDTNATDSNGLPHNTISFVVEGGDPLAIAGTIAGKKTPGAGTYGTTAEVILDSVGVPHTINFFRPSVQNIAVAITLVRGIGYTTAIGVEIQTAVAAYINGLAIGQNVLFTRLFMPANLNGSTDSLSYEVTAMTIGLVGGSLVAADYAVGFTGLAQCNSSNVVLTTI